MSVSTERKIHFFQYRLWKDAKVEQTREETRDFFKHIGTLDFAHGHRYLSLSDGESLSLLVDSVSPAIRAKIALRRTTGLPNKEKAGQEYELELGDGESLQECSHFILFPTGIMGFEFNFHAPRPSSLCKYLEKIQNGVHKAVARPLVKNDFIAALDKLSEIHLIDVEVYRSRVNQLKELDQSLYDAFNHCRKLSPEAEKIKIVISRTQRDTVLQIPFLNLFTRKKSFDDENFRDTFASLSVKGRDFESNKLDVVDLLEDKFIRKISAVKSSSTSRALKSSSVFTAIQEAYTELEKELLAVIQ